MNGTAAISTSTHLARRHAPGFNTLRQDDAFSRPSRQLNRRFIMAVLWNRAGHYSFALWFRSSIYLPSLRRSTEGVPLIFGRAAITLGSAHILVADERKTCGSLIMHERHYETRMWAYAQRDGRHRNIGSALC